MASYKVQVVDPEGRLIVGATLNCPDDRSARRRFETLPLPDGAAELRLGSRLVAQRGAAGQASARAAAG